MYNLRLLNFKDAEDARRALASVGADADGVRIMTPKALFRIIKVHGVTAPAANILKQELLARGGDAAVSRGVVSASVTKSDVLLMGTNRQLRRMALSLARQPFGLSSLGIELRCFLDQLVSGAKRVLKCRGYDLELGQRTIIMGILNLTPDSFSDGGSYKTPIAALERAQEMVSQGADIIDVGAESTRPGADPVTVKDELERLLPVLDLLGRELKVPVSVDTYKGQVARAALESGVHLINDVWGLKHDRELARLAAEYRVPLILMHNQEGTWYEDLLGDVIGSLRQSVAWGEEAGVDGDQIIVDPGIGFGKDKTQNLEVMDRLDEFRSLGKPILVGTSRKSFIGNTLGLPINERVEGTAATVALAIARGADVVRVHDVREMVRVVRMTDAMVRRGEG